ncbi:hypothetical protein CAEBREN_17443 [Caenorhabditis brenneri]|uniref:C-type lectin domain-containing protein n=1 Tax=Caenorhabditis brenneri TaxID=135651 RepID=G0P6H7_CAEBE|nr:hypothetical protein CAEBREN_17443 [Caenorhabditis brenneri]
MLVVRISIFLILAAITYNVYCENHYSAPFNLRNNGSELCPPTWMTFGRPDGYRCVKVFYGETEVSTAEELCQKHGATLLKSWEIIGEEPMRLAEAIFNLNKEMKSEATTYWSAVDMYREEFCELHAETYFPWYDCSPTRAMYVCEKL